MWTAEDRERYEEDGRRYPSDLTDAEWELVRSLFERYATSTKDLRVMVEGCLHLAGEGCRWRSLPKDFGPWQTVRGCWDRSHRDGVWADAAAVLTPAARARLGKSPAPSTAIEAGSTTWLSIRLAASRRCSRKPSRPASWMTETWTGRPVRRSAVAPS